MGEGNKFLHLGQEGGKYIIFGFRLKGKFQVEWWQLGLPSMASGSMVNKCHHLGSGQGGGNGQMPTLRLSQGGGGGNLNKPS